jgi:glycosyltransferase involved in cell wall biosynthesis
VGSENSSVMKQPKIKPKIGFMIPRLGITDRGAEVLIYELSKNLYRDFDITIWTRKSVYVTELISDLEKRGIHICRVNCIVEDHWIAQALYRVKLFRQTLEKFHLQPSEIEMLAFSIGCFPQLLKKKMDLLFPVNGIWGAFVCRLIRVITGTPFIYASVGGIEPLIAKQKPNILTTINPGIKEWLNIHFPQLSVAFISTGVDIEKFKPKGIKAPLDLPQPIFMTVSALIPQKRIDLTIKAVGKVGKGSLLIIGNGPQKSDLYIQAQKYLGNGHFLFQSVNYKNLPEFYRSADVFVHAAPAEVGWGLVHLEALATNLPVVANSEKNLRWLLKDTGLTCNVKDINNFANTLSNALILKVGNRPRKRSESFSWEKISQQYKKYFYELVLHNNVL